MPSLHISSHCQHDCSNKDHHHQCCHYTVPQESRLTSTIHIWAYMGQESPSLGTNPPVSAPSLQHRRTASSPFHAIGDRTILKPVLAASILAQSTGTSQSKVACCVRAVNVLLSQNSGDNCHCFGNPQFLKECRDLLELFIPLSVLFIKTTSPSPVSHSMKTCLPK